jgi:hypothetical protein
MVGQPLFRRLAVYIAVACIGLFPRGARSADMPTKAPPPQGCIRAVDGLNGKLDGFAGSFAGKSYDMAQGALAAPLGCGFGAQVDLMGGNFDGRFLGTAAGHLFWRNPAQGLLGAYGDVTQWNQFGGVRAGHVGPEAEWYNGQWTLLGVTGVEFGNSASGTVGPFIQTFNVPTRFFDEINLAYYPQDNLEVYAGQRYLGGRNAAALGGEWGIPMSNGIMAALFAEGRLGGGSTNGIWAGMRFYFGQKDKTLIRRHREDDPTNWNNGPASVYGSSNNLGPSTPAPITSCPLGFALVGGHCVPD